MQKWTAYLFAAVVVGFVLVLVVKTRPPSSAPDAVDAGADGAVAATDAGVLATDGEAKPEEAAGPSDAGTTLPNGEPAPALAGQAPKSVAFGAILVQYKGAQGAQPGARSREAALELAKQLSAEAKQDFKAAVAKGDKGSQENLGHIPRGYFEPAPEFVLFNLDKGSVSDPVDTPRGYLIFRRIE